MPDSTPRLNAANRAALAALFFVLAGSVGVRVYLHERTPAGVELPADEEAVDLGEGVLLPRAEATSRTGRIAPCDAPVAVDFVPPTSPDGDAPSGTDERTSYVYRGRVLDGRLAPLEVKALHYLHRALGMLRIAERTNSDELAVRVIVPADCDISPDAAMAVLRRQALRAR